MIVPRHLKCKTCGNVCDSFFTLIEFVCPLLNLQFKYLFSSPHSSKKHQPALKQTCIIKKLPLEFTLVSLLANVLKSCFVVVACRSNLGRLYTCMVIYYVPCIVLCIILHHHHHHHHFMTLYARIPLPYSPKSEVLTWKYMCSDSYASPPISFIPFLSKYFLKKRLILIYIFCVCV